MEKVEILLNVMSLAVKFSEKDTTISNEISALSGAEIDVETQEALKSFEENLIKKISEDTEYVTFARTHFENTSIVDIEYVLAAAEVNSMQGIDVDVLIGLLNTNKTFLRESNTFRYYYSLSNAAVSTGHTEAIRLAITKLHQLQGGN